MVALKRLKDMVQEMDITDTETLVNVVYDLIGIIDSMNAKIEDLEKYKMKEG